MENSFFVFTNKTTPVKIERFHICTWEFNNDSALVEFGFEVSKESLTTNQLSISLYIPWLTNECIKEDLYNKLKIEENSRFIFNDSIKGRDNLDANTEKLGVIHRFNDRGELCILPIEFDNTKDKVITLNINLQKYTEYQSNNKPNIYFRFSIKPKTAYISMRKNGISKSTVIYDIKINERRNIPDNKLSYFSDKEFSEINSCFLFNIIPNKYDIVFFDNSSLKNVRTLEFDSFNKYLNDKRVKKDELMVLFNKKPKSDSFSFFSIYAKERIGIAQFSLAIMLNILCGLIFFIASIRSPSHFGKSFFNTITHLPLYVYFAVLIMLGTIVYFIWPKLFKK